MEKHISLLGALYLALGVLGLIGAAIVIAAVFGGGLISGERQVIAITGGVAAFVGGLIIALSLPALICGIGLFQRRGWARVLSMVLAALNILNIPFGTALGVYTFWVMLKPETAAELR